MEHLESRVVNLAELRLAEVTCLDVAGAVCQIAGFGREAVVLEQTPRGGRTTGTRAYSNRLPPR